MTRKNRKWTGAVRGVDKCSVDGCERLVKTQGLCDPHYKRLWRYGSPTAGQPARGEALAFLHALKGHAGDDCVSWPYARDALGYPFVSYNGGRHTASRVMCIIEHGDPPTPKHEAAHNCGKGRDGCVNPRHLRWATHAENMEDRLAHGTHNRGGQMRANHRLTADLVRAIREKRADGQSLSSIAREISQPYDTVRAAASGRNWAWLE